MLKQLIEKELGHKITDKDYSDVEMIFEIKSKARRTKKEKTYWKDLIVLADRLSNRYFKIN
jgi:predicted metal-dependent hydrolase